MRASKGVQQVDAGSLSGQRPKRAFLMNTRSRRKMAGKSRRTPAPRVVSSKRGIPGEAAAP